METCPRDHRLPVEDLNLAKGRTWAADKVLRLLSAHLEQDYITIPAGTRLRAEQSLPSANIWLRTVVFRLFVLDGPHAGNCVYIETDDRADLTREGLRRAATADEYWDMGPGQPGSDAFRCQQGTTTAHLYSYDGGDDDPHAPRCGAPIRFADTRPAVYGDSRCFDCERWFEVNVYQPMVG
jgi:hypothetical protein